MAVIRAPLYSKDLRPAVRTLPLCLSLHVSWNGAFILLPLFSFLTFSPSHSSGCFVRRLSSLCFSRFITCRTIQALMFLHAQLHCRQPQSRAVSPPPFFKNLEGEQVSRRFRVSGVRSNWGWASGAKGQSGRQSGAALGGWGSSSSQTEKPIAQLHASLAAVFCMSRQVERATVLHNWTLHLSSLKGWAC